ncbi:MAG: hypothetical protein JXA58_08170 [Dehalococcoidia bacterium]|jgi:hypothetical protein|nr:hypothetical protein [Dehalococcoidia bacterium]
MDRRNTLYYAAAAGTVLVFIIALVGLTTCGNGGSTTNPQEQAVINAYQQGYMDGYSKGYADGFSSGMKSGEIEQAAVTSTNRGCAVPASQPEEIVESGSEE